MGLDMRPMGKPLPGKENRFREIFELITGSNETPAESLIEEWFNIQTSSYETIKAPMVGRDEAANKWIKERYEESDKSVSEAEFIEHYNGFYVIELSPYADAVPIYCNPEQDANVFRGQFLSDCMDIIDNELINEAWMSKLADETLDYGNRLLEATNSIAETNNLTHLKTQIEAPGEDFESLENKVHVLYSLSRWLIFYGQNGHGYEADF